MIDLLSHAFKPVVLIFIVSTLLASGLGLTVSQIFGPFRNLRITVSFLVGSFILVPLLAVAVSRLLGIEPDLRYALVVLAMGAGAEIGSKLTTIAGGNVGLTVGLLIASIAVSIFYVPLMLGLLLPDVHIETGHLLAKLLITVALPLTGGLVLKARFERFADAIVKWVHKISTVFMVAVVALIMILNFQQIIGLLGTGAILAAVLYIFGGFGIGYLLGWPDRGSRLAMGFMHAGRNSSIGLVVVSQVFSDKPQVLLMVTLVYAMMVMILIPLAFVLRTKPAPSEK